MKRQVHSLPLLSDVAIRARDGTQQVMMDVHDGLLTARLERSAIGMVWAQASGLRTRVQRG